MVQNIVAIVMKLKMNNMKHLFLIISLLFITSCSTVQLLYEPFKTTCNVSNCKEQLTDCKELPLCYNHLVMICQCELYGSDDDKKQLMKIIFNETWISDSEFVEYDNCFKRVCGQYLNMEGK